jgi:riboflavin kinase/FMN adenylyltransferase
MIVARSLDDLRKDSNSVVTVGTFDGVHLAHQEIVREVVQRAAMEGGRSVVVTFDPHPKEVVASAKGPVSLLTTIAERIEILSGSGIDVLFIIEFTREFSRLSSHEFYERYLVNGTGVGEVVVGYDHMFGRDRQGTIEELLGMGKTFGFTVHAFHPYTVNGEIVSSTLIRKALAAGDVERARIFLGRNYSLHGSVVRGDGRGTTIGFPTANIKPDSQRKLIPARGVYLVAATVRETRVFGMLNIGVVPTFTDGVRQTMEVHLFDFAEEIYDEQLTITFLKRLRDERKFPSAQELVQQLERDKQESLRFIAEQEQSF